MAIVADLRNWLVPLEGINNHEMCGVMDPGIGSILVVDGHEQSHCDNSCLKMPLLFD